MRMEITSSLKISYLKKCRKIILY